MLRTEGSTHVDIITHARAHHLTAPETALRLIAAQVHPGLTTPIPIYYGGRLVTRLDCGWRKEKVSLFYDGEHQLTRKQHDYDAEVTLILHDLG